MQLTRSDAPGTLAVFGASGPGRGSAALLTPTKAAATRAPTKPRARVPLRRRPALLWVRGWNFRNARQPARVESRIRTCAHSGTQCGAFGLASRHSESGHCRKSEPCPGSTRGFGVGTPGLAPREPPRARDPSHWHRRHRSGLDPGPLSHPGPAWACKPASRGASHARPTSEAAVDGTSSARGGIAGPSHVRSRTMRR